MVQNRNKLLVLFIGTLSTAIEHTVLERSTDDPLLSKRYMDEIKTSFNKAKMYREKINPRFTPLPERDIGEIRRRLANKTRSELNKRISKGYNVCIELVEETVDEYLKKLNVI